MAAFRDSGVGDRRVTRPDGSTVIAATMRPDGSIRKERRVKPGFTPPDEIAAYSAANRVAFRRGYTRSTGPIGARQPSAAELEAKKMAAKTKSQRKNEARKRRRAEERARHAEESQATDAQHAGSASAPAASADAQRATSDASTIGATQGDNETKMVDKLRKNVRKIKKRLRQIADLEKLPDLNDDQQKKVNTKGALLQKLSIAVNSLTDMGYAEE